MEKCNKALSWRRKGPSAGDIFPGWSPGSVKGKRRKVMESRWIRRPAVTLSKHQKKPGVLVSFWDTGPPDSLAALPKRPFFPPHQRKSTGPIARKKTLAARSLPSVENVALPTSIKRRFARSHTLIRITSEMSEIVFAGMLVCQKARNTNWPKPGRKNASFSSPEASGFFNIWFLRKVGRGLDCLGKDGSLFAVGPRAHPTPSQPSIAGEARQNGAKTSFCSGDFT